MFVDRVRLQLMAGKGGNGIVAWRRLRYIPKGGPWGGNGGDGGSIIIQADPQLISLDSYRNRRLLKAKNGQIGGTNCKRGKNGADLIINVPCGTLVKDAKTGELISDLIEPNQKYVICQGGRGGRGNHSFKSSTHRAPNICTEGKFGETRTVELELKLIADVGLVGFPNAGKTTLLNQLSQYSSSKHAIHAKAAPYPFTTLHPNLSYCEFEDFSRIYFADIPGIIEGAKNDRGLGLEFLRHIERTRLLLFVLDASGIDGRDPYSDFTILKDELFGHNKELAKKPYIVLLNKDDQEDAKLHIKNFMKACNEKRVLQISALKGEHLEDLLTAVKEELRSANDVT